MKLISLKIFKNKISKFFFVIILLTLGLYLFNKIDKVSATTDCPNPSSGCYCYPRHVSVTYNSCSGNKVTSATFHWDGSNCGFYVFHFYGGSSSSNDIGNVNLGRAAGTNESHTLTGINASTNLGVGTVDPARNNVPQITFDTSATNNCTPPTPTSTPTPTVTPTITPTPTPSGPTATPTLTPTPTPIFTTGDVTVHYEAIDQNNTPLPGGQKHKLHYIVLFLYKDNPNGVDFSKATPTYVLPAATVQEQTDPNANDYGYFRNQNFPMKGVASGNYYILVKAKEGSLVTEFGSNLLIPIVGGQNNVIVNIDGKDPNSSLPTTPPLLQMGDIITDCSSQSNCSYNIVDPLDYSALKDCFGYPNITGTQLTNCNNHNLGGGIDGYNIADLNDDGVVDGVDFTILFKNYQFPGLGGTTQNGGKDH
ncbi:MAG: hypothetical protein KGJ07_08310 [Patescibacteria group bacterium]|nr:hypothetical protein [Patescibacteria group bacterium]